MTTKKKPATKKEQQREATKLALLEAAESLFARYGIDSVSLRQIGNAIESGNSSVVSYYFGTKEDIIQAIFQHRFPWFNQRQGELLAEIEQASATPTLRQLLFALWYPLMEQTDKNGVHSFAGFMADLVRSGRGHLLEKIGENNSSTNLILSDIIKRLPIGFEPFRDFRIGSSLMIVTGQLRFMDDMVASNGASKITLEEYFSDGLRMAEAAISAPLD